jgi:hypothetical protein
VRHNLSDQLGRLAGILACIVLCSFRIQQTATAIHTVAMCRACLQDDGKPSSSSSQARKKAAGVARPPSLPVPREELKMVLCVNHSLGMGKGKIGAAVAQQPSRSQ